MGIVFDAHCHCFPTLGKQPYYTPECMKETQYHVTFYDVELRRKKDNALLNKDVLLGKGDGASFLPDVNFRMGHHGMVEFTYKGDECCTRFLGPTMWDMEFPPESVVARMDLAGVNRAVLQHDRVYGRLDDYLAQCVALYPDRFVALAQVDEWMGGRADQVERVRHQVKDLGFSGLYFSTGGFIHDDFKSRATDLELEPLWDMVSELEVPVHWYSFTHRKPLLDYYLRDIEDFTIWARRHPHIPSVLTHGLTNIEINRGRPDRFHIPKEIIRLIKMPEWHIELMLPLMYSDHEFPPYSPELKAVVRTLVDEVGAEKLVWGSDIPGCEETVTYTQSMVLYKTQCDFLTEKERAGILGENILRLYPQRLP